jgi:hypothetical protein
MMNPYRAWLRIVVVAGVALALWCGCSRDARRADHDLRHPEVKTVTHYDITLDESASPVEVAFVLLRAIRDDFLAKNREERERALDVQFDACAADVIAKDKPRSFERDEFIYDVVYRWTPTVSHYVHDFDTEWERAEPRLVPRRLRSSKGTHADLEQAQVFMEVNDPDGDPNARAVLVVWLFKDKGYWRVFSLGFDPQHRSIEGWAAAARKPSETESKSGD